MRIKPILAFLLLASSGSLYALDQATPNGNLSNVQPKSGIGAAGLDQPYSSVRWPYGVVPYTFDPSLAEDEKEIIKAGMEMISNPTSVTFAPLPDENNDGIADFGPVGYITFRRTEHSNYYDSAHVGWDPYRQTIVTFTEAGVYNNEAGLYNEGTVAHELMHVLGFEHAHQHPDSVSLIELHPGDNSAYRFADSYQIIFDGTIIGPYDPNSILHYRINDGLVTSPHNIVFKPGAVIPDVSIGQRSSLSQGDIDSINKIYHIDEDRIQAGFDPKFYLEQYPDVAAVYGQNNHQGAYIHWYQYGMREGRMPSLAFDPHYYLQTLPTNKNIPAELKNVEILHQQAQNGNYAGLYMHWINSEYGHGLPNGHPGSIHFDPGYYRLKYITPQNVDLSHFFDGAKYFEKVIAHWLSIGRDEGKFGTLAEEQSHQTL